MAKLTAKRRAFVEAYAGNATEAALSAGYSPKTAHTIGHESLKKPEIQEALHEREDAWLATLIATSGH
ncbi:terminase small subunit [Aminithiophilus ramosus]|uniref:Terminase small subunit n=2 Tax=Synergistales TaxID=649776 RepID=A0A9Q7APZ0_9BACT|nr:terminase small subunit [Aminithiophilus ramosus]QTX33352.1 terminase small subunit [Aminithiophilus ramosus]QVL36900.1 terminase small subunit [Synergistota bacterium]